MGSFENYPSLRPKFTQWVLYNELAKNSKYTQFLNELSTDPQQTHWVNFGQSDG